MLKKPAFWIFLVLLSLVGSVFAYQYFPQAFPIVSLNITMDRERALRVARDLAAQHDLSPPNFRQAASFSGDQRVQTFVELEGGGKEEFARMLSEGLFAAYTWRVRHFALGEINETMFRFTPDGTPYGFVEKIDEDAPGAQLSSDDARQIAEAAESGPWQIELDAYELVEQSQEVRPSERIDHTFVYERPDRQLGEGRYRLRLVVAGDRLTEVTHFIRIPEGFTRRYEEMRAANNAIGVASVIAVILYLVGAVIGLFFLLRGRWVIWRQAVFWGVLVSFLQLLVGLNQWPLLWMTYDTALSTGGFVAQQLALLLGGFVLLAGLLSLSFMAAESLTRRAFPHHPQLWQIWSRGAASSRAVLGRTVAGYLLVGVFLAYEVALYFFSTRVLGWWTPSDTLVQPDVLASYFPWLTAIASSFQAGFWEECLFRAVPLAGAALIGDRLGHRRAWIVGALVLQALVFGAAHAPYATQPPYARLVELIIPSIAFGLLYLRFGLLASIVLHFAFDVVLFALPLFVSTAPGIWLDQLMVVALALVPLWVVLGQRWRAGRWSDLPAQSLNQSWEPAAGTTGMPAEPATPQADVILLPRTVRAVLGAGIVGLVVWGVAGSWTSEIASFSTSRHEAADTATDALAKQGVTLPEDWLVLPHVEAGRDQAHRFIWETNGEDRYSELLGSYLSAPHWEVRVVTFEGDVAARAEQWVVQVTGNGSIQDIWHQLPESEPGSTLTEGQARELAHAAVRTGLGLDPSDLEDVSATPSKLDARTDWVFTFADRTTPELARGERRIDVSIAGDEVVGVNRYIHVPEEWERQQRSRRLAGAITQGAGILFLVGIFLVGGVSGVVSWSRKKFSVRICFVTFAILLLVGVAALANGWPAAMAGFSTAQPLNLQIMTIGGLGLVGLMVVSALFAVTCGVAPRWSWNRSCLDRGTAIQLALALGALAAGASVVAGLMPSDVAPEWPAFSGADSYLPLAAAALRPVTGYIATTAVLMLLFGAADKLTHQWTRRTALLGALAIVTGLLLHGMNPGPEPALWAVSGTVTGLLMLAAYVFVLRFDITLTPVAVAAMVILGRIPEGLHRAFPGALPGTALGIVVIAMISWWWFTALRRERGGTDEAAPLPTAA